MPLRFGTGVLTKSSSLRRTSSMVTVEQQATAFAAKAQPAPTAVSSKPAKEQRRHELQRHGYSDGGDGAGELEYQPVLGDALHPECNYGHEMANGENPEVGYFEGNERVPPGKPFAHDGDWLGDCVRVVS